MFTPLRQLVVAIGLLTFVHQNAAALGADEAEFRFTPGSHGGGELKYVKGIPVLFLSGTPEEMGEQQGVLVARDVKPLMEFPRMILERHGIGKAWPVVAALGRGMIKNAPERYQRELAAGIEHSGLDPDVVKVGNALVEMRRFGGCSAIVVDPARSETGATIFGRNLDFPTYGVLHKYSLLVVARPEGVRPFVSVTFPGMSGVLSGMNDAGLAVATLDVYRSKDEAPFFDPRGTPLAMCYRRLLEECGSVEEAIALMRKLKPTTYMNLAVADATGGAVLEITPRNVEVRRSSRGVTPCTNHFCSEKLGVGQDCWRYDVLKKLEESDARDKVGLSDVASALHAANQGEWTLQTMIFEPATLKLHLRFGEGPVTGTEMVELDVKELIAHETDE